MPTIINIPNKTSKSTYIGSFIKAKRKGKMIIVGYKEPFLNKAFKRAYKKALNS